MTQNLRHRQIDLQEGGIWEEAIATIPQGREDLLLEVVLMHSGIGGSEVELRSLAWANGLGWYRQSTLRLDTATAQKLLGALGSVRRRLEPIKPAPGAYRPEARILEFPGKVKAEADSDDEPASFAQ